jgi:hypothetical protein
LTSKTAIINTVATKMGAANIANIVSIFAVPRANNARERAARGFVPRPVQIRPLGVKIGQYRIHQKNILRTENKRGTLLASAGPFR